MRLYSKSPLLIPLSRPLTVISPGSSLLTEDFFLTVFDTGTFPAVTEPDVTGEGVTTGEISTLFQLLKGISDPVTGNSDGEEISILFHDPEDTGTSFLLSTVRLSGGPILILFQLAAGG